MHGPHLRTTMELTEKAAEKHDTKKLINKKFYSHTKTTGHVLTSTQEEMTRWQEHFNRLNGIANDEETAENNMPPQQQNENPHGVNVNTPTRIEIKQSHPIKIKANLLTECSK